MTRVSDNRFARFRGSATRATASRASEGRAVTLCALRPALASLVALSALTSPLRAQGIRISGASTARYIELRPLLSDSVSESAAIDTTGLDRLLRDGTLARCQGDGYCRFLRAGPVAQFTALMQDIDATAWGFGKGISARTELRFRDAVGDGRSLWPQAQQHLDVLALYADVDRDRWRARVGRQWYSSSLGFQNFDGVRLEAQPVAASRGLLVEGYAGWSLIQGLSRDVTSGALAAVEDLTPDSRGVLLGGAVRWRPANRRGSVRAGYEREIRQDRQGLYAERANAAADVWLGHTHLASEMTYDFSTGNFNEARINATQPVTRSLELVAEARHSSPFFPLWTIWGTFAPVGFDEGRLDARWTAPGSRIELTGRGAYRRYAHTDAGLLSLPLRNDGWRLGGSLTALLSTSWALLGNYGVDVGSVASRSDGDVSLRWRRGERLMIATRATAFETISEWRVGTGRVLGAGADFSFALRPDLQLAGDAMLYAQRSDRRPTEGPWNQRRATLRLEWSVGGDPGISTRERRRP